jgi:hypothetical protein
MGLSRVCAEPCRAKLRDLRDLRQDYTLAGASDPDLGGRCNF